MTPTERRERALREAVLEAGRRYDDGRLDSAPNMLELGARLRLAVQEWRRAEREVTAERQARPVEVVG